MLTIFSATPDWARFTKGSDDPSAEVAVARVVLSAAKRRMEVVPTINVCGHELDESDIDALLAACDAAAQEVYDVRLERRIDRAAQWDENFR